MTAQPGGTPERLPAGIVGKAHGLDGSVYVVQANLTVLKKGASVFVGDEPEAREIVRRAGTDERPILRLAGAESRNDAEALRGQQLSVSFDDAPPLGDQEFWAHELVGCTVVTSGTKESLGEVAEMLAYPSCELLRVTGSERGELLIPLIGDAIIEIDAAAKQIVVDGEFLALDE